MPPISPDNPLYFITAVTHNRLPIFAKDAMRMVLASAFDEARTSAGIKIFAYVIMPDHYHVVTDSDRKPSDVVRYLNGISARRIIDHLKANQFQSSLEKLRKIEPGTKDYRYSVWQHHSNTFLITTESMVLTKAGYIHQNPVEGGLIADPNEYKFSSARFWHRRPLLEDEPLVPDLKHLVWRNRGRASR